MENKKGQDAGASKSAGQIIAAFDPRLRDPARIVVRAWGYLLVAFTIYLMIIGVIRENLLLLSIWVLLYFSYLLSLEVSRRLLVQLYDRMTFHSIRILFNLVMITWLISIIPELSYIFGFFYLIPIFAGIVYFANRIWVGIATLIIALAGLLLSELLLSPDARSFVRFAFLVVGITFFSIVVYWLYHHAIKNTAQFSLIVWDLHRTLDINELIRQTAKNAIQITSANRCLVIITDPQRRRYISHVLFGFELREGVTMDGVVRECSVLSNKKPFDCPDISSVFREKNIYYKYFKSQPKSILAEPLFDSEGRIIGVLNVAHDSTNHFEDLAKTQLKEFSGTVSSAIANCLSNRKAKLIEAREIDDEDEFIVANNEDEIIRILAAKLREKFPDADGHVIHDYDSASELLEPVYASNSTNWQRNRFKKPFSALHFGMGIAGQSLQLKEPVLVYDVQEHPWYVDSGEPNKIRSLLSAPVIDPDGEKLYGTITVFAEKKQGFKVSDEIVLTILSCQVSLAYARIRRLNILKEKGSVMKRISDEIRKFDLKDSEDLLYKKITSAAVSTLDFGVARLRILDDKTGCLITKAVSGVDENTAERILEDKVPVPLSVIKPFFTSKYRVERSYIIHHDDLEWQAIANNYFFIPEQTLNKQTGWRAYDALLTPLIGQSDQIIGLITLDMPKDGLFPPPETLEAIGVFTNAAAWALELARAQNKINEQRSRSWALLGSLGPKLASIQDFESLGELVVQFGAQIINAEGCSLHIIRGSELELTHSTFLAGTKYINRKKRISTNNRCGLSSWVAATGEVLCFKNRGHKNHPAWAGEEDHLTYLESGQCYSLLIAPVVNKEEKIIGVITLENKKSTVGLRDFDDDDVARIRWLASQFSQALETMERHKLVQKWERKGIEDDLHDLINWYHSGVVLRLDALSEWFRRKEFSKVASELPGILSRAYTSVQELKTIHTDLRNTPLEDASLKLELERMILAWSNRATLKYKGQINVILDCPDNIKLPEIIQNALLRIASGAVANSILHSGIATDPKISIRVEVNNEKDNIELKVSDNGNGKKEINEGYGITRMRQLTAQLYKYGVTESDFRLDSDPEKGTTIFVKICIPKSAGALNK
jgi:signal transduction histidine kinase/GAF domain-containing protein